MLQHPPAGTITLLFAAEDSTPPAESLEARFTVVVMQHGGTLRQAAGATLTAAFFDAAAAAAAACSMQQMSAGLRVVLHTLQENTADQIRGWQLLSLGHAGQILLSAAAAEQARATLPAEISLLSLGWHRLRDLQHVEEIYQLVHPALPAEFPPLRSLDAIPNNLPLQLTRFIGREREMTDLARRLATDRLVVLIGPGGCGKTRLALQIAADQLAAYAHGVWLVELASLADPDLVLQAAASALGVREEAGRPLLTTLIDHLRDRQLLLLLDNCEHLVAACAALVEKLLAGCPYLRILATSRTVLAVGGEQVWTVPSLSLPSHRGSVAAADLAQSEAVRLFADRAAAVAPGFTVTDANAAAVAQVCHRLDGIPLAVELAAARTRVLSPEQIAARLDGSFRLLTVGSRTAAPRQQTLRGAVEWSDNLLSEPERVLWYGLSTFVGGFTLGAAEEICLDQRVVAADVLDLLARLVDHSLVIAEEQPGEKRFRLLEIMRQYGEEQAKASGTLAKLHRHHLAYYLALAERAAPELAGPQQAAWRHRLEQEHDNLRAALTRARELREMEAAVRLGTALAPFWAQWGYVGEGRVALTALLSVDAQVPARLRARLREGAGDLVRLQGDYTAAGALYQESLDIWHELGDARGIAVALINLGIVEERRGNYRAARPLFEEGLAIRQRLADQAGTAQTLTLLARVVAQQSEFDQASAYFQESLTLLRAIGDKLGTATALNGLGRVVADGQGDWSKASTLLEEGVALAREVRAKTLLATILNNLAYALYNQGLYERAAALHEEALALNRELGRKQGIGQGLFNMGIVALRQGDLVRALSLVQESLQVRRELKEADGIAWCLETLAWIAAMQGQPEQATRLFGAGEVLRETISYPLIPAQRALYERGVAAARSAVAPETFAQLWAKGRAMALEDAIAYALDAKIGAATQAPPASIVAPVGAAELAGLTPRELEILQLIAQALTAREIGARLYLSPRTVEKHEENIRNKLDQPNRASLVAWAVRQGLGGNG